MEPANDKSFNALDVPNSVKVNRAGAYHAQLQIRQGFFDKGDSFTAPSAAAKHAFLKKEPAMFGSWFLGRVAMNSLDLTDSVSYPFSSDFKTVSRQALVEARDLANKNGDIEIAQVSDQLIRIIDGNTIPLNSGVAGISMNVKTSKGSVNYETFTSA